MAKREIDLGAVPLALLAKWEGDPVPGQSPQEASPAKDRQ